MANPATGYRATVDEGEPTPTGLSQLPPAPAEGTQQLSPMGALQQQVMETILMKLNEPKPQRTLMDRLTTYGVMTGAPTRKERDWEDRQKQAGSQIQALNAMTGMGRMGQADERIDIARGNLALRGQSQSLAEDRLRFYQQKYGAGTPVKMNVQGPNGEPMTRIAWQVPPKVAGEPGEVVYDEQADAPQPIKMEPQTTSQGMFLFNPYSKGTERMIVEGGPAYAPGAPGQGPRTETAMTVFSIINRIKGDFAEYAKTPTLKRYAHQAMISPLLGKPQEWLLGGGAAIQNLARMPGGGASGASVATELGNLNALIVNLRSGQQVSEPEAARLRAFLPSLMSDAPFAQRQLDMFMNEFLTRIKANAAANPAFFTDQKLQEQGLSREMLGLPATEFTPATGTPSDEELGALYDEAAGG